MPNGTEYVNMQNLDRDIEYVEKYIETCKYLSPEHRIALIADAALLKLKAIHSKEIADAESREEENKQILREYFKQGQAFL